MIHQRFKTAFAKNIFFNKYAHGGNDSWDALAERLVDDVCGSRGNTLPVLMSDGDRKELAEHIKAMRFLPGGRYLYYAGRPYKAYNNCFSADTRFVTDKGIKSFSNFFDGQEVNVLSPITRGFLPATIKEFGKQELFEITFQNLRGKSTKQWKVVATKNHRWPLRNNTITENLQVGDIVPASGYINGLTTDDFKRGVLHGMVFADGNQHTLKDSFAHQLRLCKRKAHFVSLFEEEHTITYPSFANGDPVVYVKSPFNMKELPNSTENFEYIRGFLMGWKELDGYDGSVKQIHSINKQHILFFQEWCWLIGMVVTGNVRVDETPTNFGERKHPLHYVNFTEVNTFAGFKVVSMEPKSIESVWCVVEPEHHQFTLENGIATGNCYLLRAEEDTREEWSNVTWRAMSCLMTGGGIGIDYSRLRPAGRPLSRTGGVASGPLPLMSAINEIGRNVMQGGSRRSAIYASLNWQHEDIPAFLTAKNWDSFVKERKASDFNFPAPLDMTNISVNYDDAALEGGLSNNEVFKRNVRQAMETGEPGFSFNFGDKQNETLRNACTEVTSEDDSDVCNLGSINLGNIRNLEEFKSVVELASKFLVCGTLRADLPYEKVYKVREKNRRLGLGLMGIHEWLLQRGQKYEVTDELKQWLEVYRDESKRAADDHCDRFYISRPVAYRAIAPTGTIGILASTTTGIEPLFAVAYKRRYLTDGTKWKYEYVVDATADRLIKEYGLKPENIDTAYKLSHDYERRIKFQADIQDYVDMSISSTINLPAWGTSENNSGHVDKFAGVLAKYAPRLRGFTCYPDGSRGGQPITECDYETASNNKGTVFEEVDICEWTGHGGSCGV